MNGWFSYASHTNQNRRWHLTSAFMSWMSNQEANEATYSVCCLFSWWSFAHCKFCWWNMLISFLLLLCSILCCWDLRQIFVMAIIVDWLTSFTVVINTEFSESTKWVRLLVPLLYCNYNVQSTNSIVSTVSPWPPLDRLFFNLFINHKSFLVGH